MLIWHCWREKRSKHLWQVLAESRGVGEDTNVPRKVPRVDARLTPQALDLLDDEPRMIKEALAGRGQRDTTAIARQEVYTKLLLHSTNAGDAVEACNDSGGCTGISSRGRRRRGMPANPDEIAPSVFTFYPMRQTAKTLHSCGCWLNSAA
jgi:hypothetical protein